MNTSNIEMLLSNAAKTKNARDYDAFFQLARGMELFFNVTTLDASTPGVPISVPLVEAAPGLNAVLFFVSNNNQSLKKPFGGLVWEKALEMVVNMPQADGLVIQGDDAAWIGIDKEKAKALLADPEL